MELTKEFWEKCYKENAAKMLGVCRRYIADTDIAEDIMHDAFILAISKSDSFLGKGRIEAWLRKIVVNAALTHIRNSNTRKINDFLLQNEWDYIMIDESDSSTVRNVIEQADFTDAELLEIIDSLPEPYKLVFNLYVIDNFSHAEIGKELNISPGTSKSYLARARRKIQSLLYEKALVSNREKKKKRKIASIWFLPLSINSNFIDGLYKNKFSNYKINPEQYSLTFDANSLRQISISALKAHKSLNFSKYIIITTSVVGLLVSSLLIIPKKVHISHNETTVSEDSAPTNHSAINLLDTVDSCSGTPAPIPNPAPVSKTADKKVFIEKTIIERKTVIIRDTVRITDTADAR